MKRISVIKNMTAAVCAVVLCCLLSVPAAAADFANESGKTGDLTVLYGFVALLSLLLIVVYLLWKRDGDKKFLLLFCCVAAANCGYFLISVSGSVSAALWANRLAYLGCAFAVLMMLLIVAEVCRTRISGCVMVLLIAVAGCAFLLAATGGWLKVYYTDVSITSVNGMTVLVKSYGPLHQLYTIYILAYFALMAAVIIRAHKNKRISSVKYAVFLAATVLGNIAVWAVEQLISIEFEFLSISYIVTEISLLLMRMVVDDYDRLREEGARLEQLAAVNESTHAAAELPVDIENLFRDFSDKVTTLTASERMVLQYQIDGYDLEQTAEKLFISVNTVRKHNSNLRRKLEMNSREELGIYIDLFRRAGRLDEITYMK